MPPPPIIGRDIQPPVEARIVAARAILSPPARRQQESEGALGHLLLTCLADESVAQYGATGAPGLVVHWPHTHAMWYVPLDRVAEALAPALDRLPALAGAQAMATVDALLWTVDPAQAAVIVVCDAPGISAVTVRLHERPGTTQPGHSFHEPHPPAILPAALLQNWPDQVPTEVIFARALQGDTVCYSVVSPILGSLGRIIVQPVGAGQIEIRADFLAGDADPQRTATREAAFRSVIAAIRRYLEPRRPPDGRG